MFTVEVTQLDGPDGETVYEVEFDDDGAERLEKLKEKIADMSSERAPPLGERFLPAKPTNSSANKAEKHSP